jgi:2'-5' RNA ligase/GNAT superfamily N-acetyltransferase
MARRRLGVALVVPGPVGAMVDALRTALGDPRLGRVPPHVTLVPPVNVPETSLGAALDRLRVAAAAAPRSLTMRIGPPTSFLPDNPVLILGMGGDAGALDRLRALRDKVFQAPLERTLAWPWVPHVTLLDGAEPATIASAVELLGGFSVEVSFDTLHLLEEGPDRVWRPLAGERLGSSGVVGRGGLALTISESVMADPEVSAFLDAHAAGVAPDADAADAADVADVADVAGGPHAVPGPGPDDDAPGSGRDPVGSGFGSSFFVARRDGEVVGVAVRDRRWLETVVVAPEHRRQGIGAHLLARVVDGRRRTLADWDSGVGFLERHGWLPADHLMVRELSDDRTRVVERPPSGRAGS